MVNTTKMARHTRRYRQQSGKGLPQYGYDFACILCTQHTCMDNPIYVVLSCNTVLDPMGGGGGFCYFFLSTAAQNICQMLLPLWGPPRNSLGRAGISKNFLCPLCQRKSLGEIQAPVWYGSNYNPTQ